MSKKTVGNPEKDLEFARQTKQINSMNPWDAGCLISRDSTKKKLNNVDAKLLRDREEAICQVQSALRQMDGDLVAAKGRTELYHSRRIPQGNRKNATKWTAGQVRSVVQSILRSPAVMAQFKAAFHTP